MDKQLPSRPKHWKELNNDEKIERLREVIKTQDKAIIKMASYLDKMINHKHLNGNLVIEIPHLNAESYGNIHYKKFHHDEWF